ncbi:MAG TPA: hypothetical protein VKY27_12635 [Bacteriovoracaceae bacterium]|nr:hypothetical protein [Bacteriovoracaceae bacterium]
MKLFLALMLFSPMVFAYDFGDLKPSDQKYFKNEYGEGNNKLERIDMNVKEINKIWGEVNALKAEIKKLRDEVALLKEQKK